MKLILALLVSCFILVSCQYSSSNNQTYVRDRLTQAMTKFLYEEHGGDTSKVHYDIQKVYYFEEKTFFNCQFTVHMKLPNYDTTGFMSAEISKDFETVKRKS